MQLNNYEIYNLISSILGFQLSFLHNSTSKNVRKKSNFLSNRQACVIEQQATLFRDERTLLPHLQFRGQYWRIITLPVRYLSTPSYCMQGNNYHTLLQFDVLQCKTTCRARCGFSSIGRFLRFLSRGIVSVLFPAVVRITGFF